MPKRISIAEHLSISKLEQLYKHAKDGIESRQSVSDYMVSSARQENS